MRLALYAHPFDVAALADRGGLPALRDLGFQEIALATAYHDGRWLMPWHPDGHVRFLEDGCVHFRPRGSYGPLSPQPSTSVPPSGPSPLETLLASAPAAGLDVRAWTVGTHNTRLGERARSLCVQNARGDVYPYALCPSQPAVQHYLATLARDLAAHSGLAALELEAFGQMGWKHSSHHDKASFSPAGLLEAALSACFCSACTAQQAAAGFAPESVRAAVRDVLWQQLADGDAMQPSVSPSGPAELPPGEHTWLAAVLAARRSASQELATAVAAAVGRVALAVQVHPHPWFTGSQLALAGAAVAFPDAEQVLTAYGEGPEPLGKLLSATGWRRGAGRRRVCIWPKAPQWRSDDDLRQLREQCQQHGVDSIAIYHLGLLPWRTLQRVAKMLAP